MKHHIHICPQMLEVQPRGLAHAPLDAVSLDGFSQHTSGSQANARPGVEAVLAPVKEICHRSREILPALLVDPLIIGMPAEASATQRARRPFRSLFLHGFVAFPGIPE